ncbi:MAG: VWA domain-containing protein [Paludibacteraceae bacterium]|nr:VWA domain-containing protein [Paludibacteraceae bacterium]
MSKFIQLFIVPVLLWTFFPSVFAEREKTFDTECYLVVDVSGSMYRKANMVKPALRHVIASLKDGDGVSIVRFGTYPKIRKDECGRISPVFRSELNLAVEKIYEGNSSLLSNTDFEAVISVLLQRVASSSAKTKKVIFFSDFVNDVPIRGVSPISTDLLSEWEQQISSITGQSIMEIDAYVLNSKEEQGNSLSVLRRLFENQGVLFREHRMDKVR